jgi:hypothetical protein
MSLEVTGVLEVTGPSLTALAPRTQWSPPFWSPTHFLHTFSKKNSKIISLQGNGVCCRRGSVSDIRTCFDLGVQSKSFFFNFNCLSY